MVNRIGLAIALLHPPPVRWNGRDASGRRVPPGVYLVQVELDSDEGRKAATGTVSVAY